VENFVKKNDAEFFKVKKVRLNFDKNKNAPLLERLFFW
jgi:hypothetical protein